MYHQSDHGEEKKKEDLSRKDALRLYVRQWLNARLVVSHDESDLDFSQVLETELNEIFAEIITLNLSLKYVPEGTKARVCNMIKKKVE